MKRMLIALSIACTSCEEEEPRAGSGVPIAVVIDRTGNNSEPSWVDAIKLARRHANLGLRQAGFKRLQFEVLISDSGNEPAVATSRAYDLVRRAGAKAVIIDTSQNDIALNRTYYDADATNDLNVPLLCGSCTTGTMNNPTATDPDPITQAALRNGAGWNWRCVMSTRAISQVLVRLMLDENGGDVNGDGVFKVSFYGSDEAFGRGAAKDLRAYLTQLKPSPAPLMEELYHPRDADANSYTWAEDLRKLTDDRNEATGQIDGVPDFIAVANFAQQQAATIKAHRQSGTTVRMLHYHSARFSAVLDSLGSLAEGAEGVSHVLADGQSGQAFVAEYEQLYGVKPVYRDANYYDGAMAMMLAALIGSGAVDDPDAVSGPKIRSAMAATSAAGGDPIGVGPDEFARAVRSIQQRRPIDYQGASGPMDFDATGNVVDRLAQFRAVGGDFVDVAPFDCVGDPACPRAR